MRLGLLLALFFCSGAAGLLYEVVWLRMLVRAFGSTTIATSNVLAVFMAGLAAGAWAAGRRAKAIDSPLKAYAVVELLLGLAACLSTWLAARLPEVFAWAVPAGDAGSFGVAALRSALSALILAPPTLLMGASLPLLTEQLAREAGADGAAAGDRPGLLYGANTLGAVLGTLFAGFVGLGALGESRTVALALALNLAVGLLAWRLAAAPLAGPAASARRREPAPAEAPSRLSGWIPWWMLASGFCALALEVIWTRALVLLLGNSVYAFSAMLASFLTGIGLGSLVCGSALKSRRQAERAFAGLQALAALLVGASAEAYLRLGLARSDPAYLYSPLRSADDFWALLATSLAVVLPVTVVYGMLFPVAVKVADPGGRGEGVARVYGFNTIGSVLGSLAGAFLLIPLLGTRGAWYAVGLAHTAIAAAALLTDRALPGRTFAGFAAAALALLSWQRPDAFYEIIRSRVARRNSGQLTAHREGAGATVSVVTGARETLLLINGIIVSGKGELGRFMAHFPLALQEAPKRALIICLGAGNTFRAAVDHGVRVDLVELEEEVVRAFSGLWPDHEKYLRHPAATVSVNDGRNALLTARERYDLVVVDGTPPIFSAGAVNLYTREFIELARSRLTEAGMLAVWVPLPCFESDFWMIARNFTDAFPHTLAWGQEAGRIDGVLLLGSNAPFDLDGRKLEARAKARGLAAETWLNASLLGPGGLVSDAALRGNAARYPPVTDDRPRTEFPLPLFLKRTPLQTGPRFVLSWAGEPASRGAQASQRR